MLGRDVWGGLVWAGVSASPAIGIAAGLAIRKLGSLPAAARYLVPVATLYGAVFLFGLGVGLADALTGAPAGERDLLEVVVQQGLAAVWGITFMGYVLLLAPLSILNHLIIWKIERGGGTIPHSGSTR